MEVRWQLIRSFETAMANQNENLELRKMIDQARAEARTGSAAQQEIIKKFGENTGNMILKLREELVRLKKAQSDCGMEHEQYMTKVNGRMVEMVAETQSMTTHIHNLRGSEAGLKVDVERLEKDLSDLQALKNGDAERTMKTIDTLRTELGDADTKNKYHLEKIADLDAQVKNEIMTRESLTEEVKRLRLWIAKMEEKGLMASSEAEEQREQMASEHAMIIQALTQEGNTLRGTVAFLQEELYRVQTALHVPTTDSNFGKFVELKTENRNLVSKLESTVRGQMSNPLPNPQSSNNSINSGVPGIGTSGVKGGAKGLQRTHAGKSMRGKMLGGGTPQMSPRVQPPSAQPTGAEQRPRISSSSSSGSGSSRQPKEISVSMPSATATATKIGI